MLTHDYSYDTGLRGSVTKPWTVDDCFRGRDFDFSKPFLPERIAGVGPIGCLSDDEKRMLNQIRGNSYCHIFAFVEEYIVPLVIDRARADVYGDETRRTHQRLAYRWTFLVSGLQHPNFVRIVGEVTNTGSNKIAAAAQALSA